MNKRHFIIGDIHGAGLELERLIEKFSPEREDVIIAVGDLFDRGCHADRVWAAIKKYNIQAFLGNHEVKMISFFERKKDTLPFHYYTAMNILHEKSHLSANDLYSYLKSLPLVKDYGNFIVAHAGFNINSPEVEDFSANVYGSLPEDQKVPMPDETGDVFWWDLYKGEKLVIYGHLVTSDNKPRIRKVNDKINSIGLDTAAVHGGPLTGYCVEEDKFYTHQSGYDWFLRLKKEYEKDKPVLNDEMINF